MEDPSLVHLSEWYNNETQTALNSWLKLFSFILPTYFP